MTVETYRDGALVRRADDATRTVTTWPGGASRPYTAEENAAADARISQAGMLTDLQARLERIEAHLWPAPPDPATVDDAPEWSGIWPAGGLLRDGGRAWRNVTTVPLTSRPSEFPGTPEQWTHLFVEVVISTPPDPEPEWPQWRGEWSATADYLVGDHVSRGGFVYRCLVAHGSAYAGTWGPPTPGVWVVASQ